MTLHPLHSDLPRPERFTYPFAYEPHPLCQLAVAQVQAYVAAHDVIRADADRGKMFGVLVVEQGSDLGFLAAYSGLLAGRNDWDYFVPPVFDAQQPDGYFKQQEAVISKLSREAKLAGLASLSSPTSPSSPSSPSSQPSQSSPTRETSPSSPPADTRALSQDLQLWLFHQYQLLNARGERRDLVDLWQSYYSRPKLQRKFPLPPGGTGDCCAPKLLQYAYAHGLHPVCMAEFWWGAPTRTELRQHLNYYPACRGKCKPLLTWMLQGLDVDPDPESLGFARLELPYVYEDDYLVVVNKPSGLLSTPGRIEDYSVETIMQQRYPGAIIGHRLDMPTSGLLVVAKSIEVYRPLQEQFVRREVQKKYLAVLESEKGKVKSEKFPAGQGAALSSADGTAAANFSLFTFHSSLSAKGRISLPLRPDPMNRPRQVVDLEHGKRAVTDYEFLTDDLVALWPHTGRTHQLRIHCAHPDGLGRPIVGDELYGRKGGRLMLHAAEIWFRHPVTGLPLHFSVPFER